jgi:hypothetical protein
MLYVSSTSGKTPSELKINGTKLELVAVSATTIPTSPAVVLPVFAPIASPVEADPFSPGASIKLL